MGGPNARKDYHVEDGEELFYQIEGDITVKVLEGGKPRDIVVREGDIFLLPAGVPHSPQRPAGTIGRVVERMRKPDERDHLRWFCERCGEVLHDASFHCKDLGTELKPIIENFFADESKRICKTWRHRDATAGTGQGVRPLRIDLHTHILPKTWPDLEKRYGYGGFVHLACMLVHPPTSSA